VSLRGVAERGRALRPGPGPRLAQPVGERARRVVQREAPGRAPEPGDPRHPAGGPGPRGAVAGGLQHGPPARRPRLPAAGPRGPADPPARVTPGRSLTLAVVSQAGAGQGACRNATRAGWVTRG